VGGLEVVHRVPAGIDDSEKKAKILNPEGRNDDRVLYGWRHGIYMDKKISH
jgi:hypothetical protein